MSWEGILKVDSYDEMPFDKISEKFRALVNDLDTAVNWLAYHHESNATKGRYFLSLNGTGAEFDNGASGYFQGTAPSSSLISLNNSTYNTSGNNYVAYCWHDVVGYSKFGKLTANGSADGSYCYLGFQPSLVIIKQSSASGDWNIIDTTRQGYNHANGLPVIRANSTAVEEQASGNQGQIDILSNGFKFRSNHSSFNTSGASVVYMAWAEIPDKYSNAF